MSREHTRKAFDARRNQHLDPISPRLPASLKNPSNMPQKPLKTSQNPPFPRLRGAAADDRGTALLARHPAAGGGAPPASARLRGGARRRELSQGAKLFESKWTRGWVGGWVGWVGGAGGVVCELLLVWVVSKERDTRRAGETCVEWLTGHSGGG